jgi:hypothetical protein
MCPKHLDLIIPESGRPVSVLRFRIKIRKIQELECGFDPPP